MTAHHHLAEVNIALAREPLDSALLADFMAALGPVNSQADRATGFVWRLQTEDGDATAVRGFGDSPRMIINLSVWQSLAALRSFVFDDPTHLAVMRRRREWFERLDYYSVLWWVAAGHRPTVREAEERLAHLRRHGPTPSAFTFRRHFDSPHSTTGRTDDESFCPS